MAGAVGYAIAVKNTPVGPFVGLVAASLSAVVLVVDFNRTMDSVRAVPSARARLREGLLRPVGLLRRAIAATLFGVAVYQYFPVLWVVAVVATLVMCLSQVLIAVGIRRLKPPLTAQALPDGRAETAR